MIHLPQKYLINSPSRLLNKFAIRRIKNATDNFDGEHCSGYYRHKTITNLLRAFSLGKTTLANGDKPKCFYCESRVEKGVTLQVEHYRPKSKVDKSDNNGFNHHGYYWLGLEWTNLLLSCPKCNGKSGKGNRFPLIGKRAIPIEPVDPSNTLNRTASNANQNPLLLEQPILLNPEIDLPETCLTFDIQSYLSGYGADMQRGEDTIDILKLNRDPLIEDRQDVRNEFINDINLDIGGFEIEELDEVALLFNFKKTCRSLINRKNEDEEFSLWGRYMNDNFETCIVQMIDEDFRDLLRTAYQLVIAE
jgi:5-methylcytosine-specific restriction endonuclease McrA